MLDQNTDRMWYVIGAVLIGAAIIFGMNTLMPNAFASVADNFEQLASNIIIGGDSIRINGVHVRGDAILNGEFENERIYYMNGLDEMVVDFQTSHDGSYGSGTDFVLWFHPDDTEFLDENNMLELSFKARASEDVVLGLRKGSRIISDEHYKHPITTDWVTVRKQIPYEKSPDSDNPQGALVLWVESPAKVEFKDIAVRVLTNNNGKNGG